MKFKDYLNDGLRLGVLLDGEIVKKCIYANEEKGMIRRCVLDHQGECIVNRGVIETETVCGDVKIIEESSY